MSELLELTEKIISDKLGENITVIDMRGVNPFTDYFVIATARNIRHAAGLADDVVKEAQKNGYEVRTQEGSDGSTWILIDLKDVIVHIFTEEARAQYKLENLWSDQPITHFEETK
ncbi:MAG: ribosome silencing factor [Erysipelotrichia bacterium]|nr:ribosome silencing factor [Erysipelotrichia bacterium]